MNAFELQRLRNTIMGQYFSPVEIQRRRELSYQNYDEMNMWYNQEQETNSKFLLGLVLPEIAMRSQTGRCQICGQQAEYDGIHRGNYTEFCGRCDGEEAEQEEAQV